MEELSNDELVNRILDVIDGTYIGTNAWDQNAPHATLRVIQDVIKENIRISLAEGDWTKHYKWIPRHVSVVGEITRGLPDIKMSEKARKEVLALIEKAQKPERDIVSTTSYRQYRTSKVA